MEPTIIGAWMWTTSVDAVRLVQRSRFDKEVSEAHVWKRFEMDRLLVVDDLGIGGLTDDQFAIIWRLTDIRQRLPTIYTTNYSPEQLRERYDPRIVSRVCCGTIIEVVGADRRLAGAKNYVVRVKS